MTPHLIMNNHKIPDQKMDELREWDSVYCIKGGMLHLYPEYSCKRRDESLLLLIDSEDAGQSDMPHLRKNL